MGALAKPRGAFLFEDAGQSKLDTFESHMTFFATLDADFIHTL
jgi:hypothetical protein